MDKYLHTKEDLDLLFAKHLTVYLTGPLGAYARVTRSHIGSALVHYEANYETRKPRSISIFPNVWSGEAPTYLVKLSQK